MSKAPSTLREALVEAESHASLGARLAAYRASTLRLRPDIAQAYDALVARLDLLDRGAIGPQPGEPLPAFDLPDADGRLVSLAALLRSGPVVVSLNRGHWCPYCKLELRALAAIHDEVRGLGAQLVSIMPDSAAFTGDYARANRLPFPILSDMDLGYALTLGLVFWIGSDVERLYRDLGIALERYQGNQACFLPMGAKFIVGRDGLVKARQVDVEFRERMDPQAVLAVLRGLR